MKAHRVDSEVGRLRTVLLHRPGAELKRLTPRNSSDLLFDGIPWVGRAQEEHDAFAEALRSRDVEVLYVRDLLVEAIEAGDDDSGQARAALIRTSVDRNAVGSILHAVLEQHLHTLAAGALADVVVAGMTHDELATREGLVTRMAHGHDFVIPPLPNLVFTRDASVWVGDSVTVTNLAMPARRRESAITEVIYAHHPRFSGTERLYGGSEQERAWLEGGDVLLLGPGVIAVGVGQRTTPAAVETFAHTVIGRGLVHTVLAVPIAQERATMHLDTVCTMVAADAVVMYPPVAESLQAYVVHRDGNRPDVLSVSGPEPFLGAAATAMGIDRLRVIDTGLDAVTAEREQWDDGNNTLAIEPGLVVAYERNTETNARLEAAGIDVVRIPGSELGTGRGGPRCMSCPIVRDPG